MTRLYLDVGRDDGVRPSDIVGAIANEAALDGHFKDALAIDAGFPALTAFAG